MVHSVSEWTRGVQVKLWDPLRTRAIPGRLKVCSRQGAIQIHVYLYLYLLYPRTGDGEGVICTWDDGNQCVIQSRLQSVTWFDRFQREPAVLRNVINYGAIETNTPLICADRTHHKAANNSFQVATARRSPVKTFARRVSTVAAWNSGHLLCREN